MRFNIKAVWDCPRSGYHRKFRRWVPALRHSQFPEIPLCRPLPRAQSPAGDCFFLTYKMAVRVHLRPKGSGKPQRSRLRLSGALACEANRGSPRRGPRAGQKADNLRSLQFWVDQGTRVARYQVLLGRDNGPLHRKVLPGLPTFWKKKTVLPNLGIVVRNSNDAREIGIPCKKCGGRT